MTMFAPTATLETVTIVRPLKVSPMSWCFAQLCIASVMNPRLSNRSIIYVIFRVLSALLFLCSIIISPCLTLTPCLRLMSLCLCVFLSLCQYLVSTHIPTRRVIFVARTKKQNSKIVLPRHRPNRSIPCARLYRASNQSICYCVC